MQIAAITTSCMMLLVGLSGCAKQLGPPASPSQQSLDMKQAAQAKHILIAAMPPASGAPLTLVPVSGIRWSDLERAVVSAGKKPGLGYAVQRSDIGQNSGVLHLRMAQGWPIVVHARHVGTTIDLDVVIGPYPVPGAEAKQADRIKQEIHIALLAWGRKPSLASKPE
ncbi:MAG: hypothetical protein HOO04_04610 [Phycisphaerae bacterium]|nr:hypothetical protein [Phycisphaerae bacterium]